MAAKQVVVALAMIDQPAEPSARASSSNTASAVVTSASAPPSSAGTRVANRPAAAAASTTADVSVPASSPASASASMSGPRLRARSIRSASTVVVMVGRSPLVAPLDASGGAARLT